jgi:hypothetical protein
MKERDVATVVTQLLQDCAGYEDGDDVSEARRKALDYYFMRPRGDEVIGTSQVVSGDLSAMVEANLAQMLNAFTTDNVVEFEPDGQEDEDQVQLESDVVSHWVMDANNGYMTFLQAIKDALLLRNGIVKLRVEESDKTKVRTYENVTPEAYAGMAAQPGVEIEELEYRATDGFLKVRERRKRKQLLIEPVPPENFVYYANWTSLDLQRIPICGERHVDSRSDMIDVWGFESAAVDKLTAYVEHKAASSARNPKGTVTVRNQHADRSLDQIEWYELYVLLDTDGDGVAERRRVCIAPGESTVLADEDTEYVCYAAGSAIVNPHRFLGISLYDKLKQVQDINTGLNRSLLNNADAANKSRTAYLDGKVEVDDLNNGLVNGNIRVKGVVGDVRSAIMAFVVPDISAGILQNIEHQKRTRAELGGAALDMSAGDAQLVSDQVGSQGLDRAYSVMEQLASMMTRTIAESLIRNTYLLAHAMLRTYFDEPTNIKRHGKWQSPNPSEWPERVRLNVKIGMSAGERQRKIGALQFVLTTQLQLAQQGMNGIIVNMQGFYSTLMDWGRAAEIDNPEQYFVDPASEESKAAFAKREQAAQADKKAQANLMNMAIGLEQMRVALDKRNADADRVFKYFDAILKSEVEEAKIVGGAVGELQKIHAQADATAEDAKDTDAQVEKVTKAIKGIKDLRKGGGDGAAK